MENCKTTITFKKALIIDDDEISLTCLKTLLTQNYNFVADAFLSSLDAISVLNEKLLEFNTDFYDIIFTDINIPIVNGKIFSKIITEMKSNAELAEIPVVAISSSFYGQQIEDLKKMGISEFLEKPVSIQKLKEIFNHCFLNNK